jgi:hypothetical protein
MRVTVVRSRKAVPVEAGSISGTDDANNCAEAANIRRATAESVFIGS